MPYKKSTVIAGCVRDEMKYHTCRYSSEKRPRGKNSNSTSEKQAKMNELRSKQKLEYIILENFCENDLYITLTNRDKLESEQARKTLKQFLTKLRALYKKHEEKLKYVGVTERKGRLHHHLLINNIGVGIGEIKKVWEHGFSKVQMYAGEEGDAVRVSAYFIKESKNTFNTEEKVHGLRWISSKNLKHPEPDTKVVTARTWKEEPKAPKGYYIAYVKRGVTENNYPYQFVRMIKIPEKGGGLRS